jgi:hypothetical protein
MGELLAMRVKGERISDLRFEMKSAHRFIDKWPQTLDRPSGAKAHFFLVF